MISINYMTEFMQHVSCSSKTEAVGGLKMRLPQNAETLLYVKVKSALLCLDYILSVNPVNNKIVKFTRQLGLFAITSK